MKIENQKSPVSCQYSEFNLFADNVPPTFFVFFAFSGTFTVLSCEEEFCHILNDFLNALNDTGYPLEASSYYRQMSKQFDIGRDRLYHVLKWLNQNIQVDRVVPNTNDVGLNIYPRKDPNLHASHDE
jgi:hypothetical protein